MEEWLKKPPPLLSPFADLQKRANEGNPDAQYFLSLKYYQGEGVAQDRSEAYKWALVAASSGHKDAKNLLGELEIFMTEKEEAEGRTRAEALQANQRK
jgi:TPR repeat protein